MFIEDSHMTQHLYLLTGASRGMGLAMAQQLLAPNHTLLCLSRGHNTALQAHAENVGCDLQQWQQDLADTAQAAQLIGDWLALQAPHAYASASLINNAGVITHIAPLSGCPPQALTQALRVGLEAPMLLTATFLAATASWQVPRKVLNISSGLGRRAMASQAAYCAAKAGMDHFTRCLALEESAKPNGAKVCSLAPGVIDTDMQADLRQASPDEFADVHHFAQLKTAGRLATAEEAAKQVLQYLRRSDFGQSAVADVREE